MLKGNLTCAIVGKLLTHYVEDTLDNKCKNMVSIHLRNCPPCMEKYSVVKKLFQEAEKKRKIIKAREALYEKISEYLDGEMNENDIRLFEKELNKSSECEETLMKVLDLKKAMNNSFYKTKYNLKLNLAEEVMEKYKSNLGFKNKIINLMKQIFSRQDS